ncbi:hypothetical protein EV401DRAFT_1888790 [Pisolithus croceorrhizus]|nr:hypothetical protein EV401DRAFT_1888790 [Pisolithus croceorrhizus]
MFNMPETSHVAQLHAGVLYCARIICMMAELGETVNGTKWQTGCPKFTEYEERCQNGYQPLEAYVDGRKWWEVMNYVLHRVLRFCTNHRPNTISPSQVWQQISKPLNGLFPKLHLAAALIRPLFRLRVSGHNVLRELLVTAFHLLRVMNFRSCPRCLFPVSVPSDADVTRFLRRDLQAFLSGDLVEIKDVASSKLFTTASIHYWELIRRLLWRRTIYCKILGGDILNSFEEEVAEGVLCNAIYLDSVLDWIKRPLKAVAKFNPPHRIRLLDIYMLEEFYVGRHEPSALICWQRKNPKTNLRGGDILSKSFNWREAQQRFGQAWEGMSYRWSAPAIDSRCLQRVINDCKALFADFYNNPYPRMVTLPEETEETRWYGGVVTTEIIAQMVYINPLSITVYTVF